MGSSGGERDRPRQIQITSSGRGNGSNDGYLRGNDQRYHSSSKSNSGLYEKMNVRGNEHYEKMNVRGNDHYGSKNQYKEREREREKIRYKDNDRKRESPDKLAAERALEDLRSRLLNKRNKQDGERRMEENQSGQDYVSSTGISEKEQRYDSYDGRRSEKDSYHHKQRTKKSVIEVIDSPEDYHEIDSRQRSPEDLELIARRAKLLDANREMDKRKEKAREELEARRELRRSGKDDSPHRGSRHSASHKRKHHIKENAIMNIDNTDDEDNGDSVNNDHEVNEDDDDDDEEDDDDTASDSGTNTKSEYSESEHSEGELPTSPLSVGELTKSEHRRNRKSHSTSKSISSRSRSRSRSARSRSSRSRSRSGSRSHSRTPSQSPHTARNRNRQTTPTSDAEKEKKASSSSDLTFGAEASKATTAAASGDTESSEIKAQAPPEEKLPSYYPGLQGCRSVEEFKHLNHIAEGTYGIVYRAQDKRTEEIVALKRLKMEKEREGFPITSLREINTLLKGQHPNIVTVREIVVGCNMDKIFIVMDYVEHDFKTLMETMKSKNQSFLPGEVKCLTQQLLRAVAHLHDNWILHRDLKTSNLLLSHKGILKVGDFGLAREYGSPLKPYTSIVVTLWYRAPELLLCCKEYSTPIDMWSVGCIFAEFLSMGALFPGQSETDQLNKIFKVS